MRGYNKSQLVATAPTNQFIITVLCLVITLNPWGSCHGFTAVSTSTIPRLPMVVLSSSSSSSQSSAGDTTDEWLEKARRLRDEAKDMETKLRESTPISDKSSQAIKNRAASTTVYTRINDSKWVVTYRFANRPEIKDDQREESSQQPRSFYSGKVVVHFLDNGYTDLLSHEVRSYGKSEDDFSITKVWGWDMEESVEDNDVRNFLLFSMDVVLPGKTSQKVYLQAQQECRADGTIHFSDGTITIKQDYLDNSSVPGFWGLFSPGKGILAQFRRVGEFVMTPLQTDR